jgi:hypothetical protein
MSPARRRTATPDELVRRAYSELHGPIDAAHKLARYMLLDLCNRSLGTGYAPRRPVRSSITRRFASWIRIPGCRGSLRAVHGRGARAVDAIRCLLRGSVSWRHRLGRARSMGRRQGARHALSRRASPDHPAAGVAAHGGPICRAFVRAHEDDGAGLVARIRRASLPGDAGQQHHVSAHGGVHHDCPRKPSRRSENRNPGAV